LGSLNGNWGYFIGLYSGFNLFWEEAWVRNDFGLETVWELNSVGVW